MTKEEVEQLIHYLEEGGLDLKTHEVDFIISALEEVINY